jgi:hypothetical protein
VAVIIKELAKQAGHHVTHGACFLEALHARRHTTSYHPQWRILYPKRFSNSLACGPPEPQLRFGVHMSASTYKEQRGAAPRACF